jgi:hypothetical protein
MLIVRILAFIFGALVVTVTVLSAVKTFVLPRGAPDPLTRFVFLSVRSFFDLRLRWSKTYCDKDRIMAFYAPVSILALLPVWLALVALGYMGMFWALGAPSWLEAYKISGSSLLTLGIATATSFPLTLLEFTEATIGLLLVALLIAYLPTMYAAFQRREAAVTLLEVRAGSPPSAIEMILRFHRIHGLDRLSEQWRTWESWFVDIQESHTSLAALVFFRSPRADHSWVTAAGAVLDAAALTRSTVDIPSDFQADLCIRAGYLALRHIADFFTVPYKANPQKGDPISVTRQEFDSACESLAAQGVPLKADRQQAWEDFAGWRVNYDTVLIALAGLTMAPEAPWSSDRSQAYQFRPFGRLRSR